MNSGLHDIYLWAGCDDIVQTKGEKLIESWRRFNNKERIIFIFIKYRDLKLERMK
jgi:hypothetical protein